MLVPAAPLPCICTTMAVPARGSALSAYTSPFRSSATAALAAPRDGTAAPGTVAHSLRTRMCAHKHTQRLIKRCSGLQYLGSCVCHVGLHEGQVGLRTLCRAAECVIVPADDANVPMEVHVPWQLH